MLRRLCDVCQGEASEETKDLPVGWVRIKMDRRLEPSDPSARSGSYVTIVEVEAGPDCGDLFVDEVKRALDETRKVTGR